MLDINLFVVALVPGHNLYIYHDEATHQSNLWCYISATVLYFPLMLDINLFVVDINLLVVNTL